MDELDLEIAFGMRWRPIWLDIEFDILKRELNFLNLNLEYKAIELECQIELLNNLVRTLEQEKVQFFSLFIVLGK